MSKEQNLYLKLHKKRLDMKKNMHLRLFNKQQIKKYPPQK